MLKIDVPKNVKLIINILEKNGYEAYAVGGCVRDAMLGKEPNDWDITTSAMPENVKNVFNKTIDTGIKHGTVTVLIERTGYEVTTYRIDGEYEDGRHPKSVEFTGNLIEDLRRRDFTINAMAYSDKKGIVDAFDGIGDLERKVIKCVGNPEDRFNEDALRILRAVRFSAVLDFDIEENTKNAIVKLAENLNKISKERIQVELEKLLMSNHPEKLKIAFETGITKVVLDEVDRLNELGKLDETLILIQKTSVEHYLRWTALLHNCDKTQAAHILKGLKFDNKTVNISSRLVEAIKKELPDTRGGVRKLIYEIGEDIFERYLNFMEVYVPFIYNGDFEKQKKMNFVKEEYFDIIKKQECISLKTLAVKGSDLIEIGAARGSEVGEGLNMLLEKVLEDNTLNTREKLIEIYMNR